MKAIVYNGPRDVAVKDVSDAKIEKPTDVLVRITTTNIVTVRPTHLPDPDAKGDGVHLN